MDALQHKRDASGRNPTISIRKTIVSAFMFCVIEISVSGCQLNSHKVEINTPPYPKQAAEVLSIVPMGTDREEAVNRLKSAGIEGSFSLVSQSVFYCDTWQREDGERWWMNVALLFDESGKLKATRTREAQNMTSSSTP